MYSTKSNILYKLINFLIGGDESDSEDSDSEDSDSEESDSEESDGISTEHAADAESEFEPHHTAEDKAIEQKIKEAEKLVKVKPEKVVEMRKAQKKKYNYDIKGEIAVTEEMLEHGIGVNQKDKLSFSEVLPTTIEVDNKEINKMVLAAKWGVWGPVFRTLDKKPYLVNCIPEERAWSVLHQAIYLDSLETVRRLVEDYDADINICTKPDRNEIAPLGTNSVTLAYKLNRNDIFKYLLEYKKTMKAAKYGEDISHFRVRTTGSVDPFFNYPLLHLTLASYKTLTPTGIVLKYKKYQHLVHVLPSVNAFPVWKDAQKQICNTLYGINRQLSDSLRKAKSREKFYREVIRVYTKESEVYHLLTPALIKQPHSPFKPLACDLALGPYAILLSAILSNWDQLKPFQETTYRGVDADVTSKYEVGQTFLFLHFISTSKVKDVAEYFRRSSGTLFIFDNGNNTWGPREIRMMSAIPHEDECLFPLGAEFKVVSVNKIKREIHLQLLNPSI